MNWPQLITAVFVCLSVLLSVALLHQVHALLALHYAADPADVEDELQAEPVGQWRALPGHRIELGATGWAIYLSLLPTHPMYRLYAPEGWLVGFGIDLGLLKATAERFAAERAEFDVPTDAQWAEVERAMGAGR